MKIIDRKDVPEQMLPGRFMQKLVGKTEDGYLSDSRILNICYCRYCAEAGPMEPHMHAEETVQILSSDRGWVRFGPAKDDLPHKVMLQPNMTLHIPEAVSIAQPRLPSKHCLTAFASIWSTLPCA